MTNILGLIVWFRLANKTAKHVVHMHTHKHAHIHKHILKSQHLNTNTVNLYVCNFISGTQSVMAFSNKCILNIIPFCYKVLY